MSDPNAIISMDNEIDIDFSKSNNIFSITVTAGDGLVQKIYKNRGKNGIFLKFVDQKIPFFGTS